MSNGVDLLRSLGSGVNGPDRVASNGAAPSGSGGIGQDFAAMLEQARGGTLETGLPVHIAKDANVELSEEQLARMGPVLDRLHASGASHALIAIDGRLVKVDVITRQVRGEFDPGAGTQEDGIDAVASVPTAHPEDGALIGVPRVGVMGRSLARALGHEAA